MTLRQLIAKGADLDAPIMIMTAVEETPTPEVYVDRFEQEGSCGAPKRLVLWSTRHQLIRPEDHQAWKAEREKEPQPEPEWLRIQGFRSLQVNDDAVVRVINHETGDAFPIWEWSVGNIQLRSSELMRLEARAVDEINRFCTLTHKQKLALLCLKSAVSRDIQLSDTEEAALIAEWQPVPTQ